MHDGAPHAVVVVHEPVAEHVSTCSLPGPHCIAPGVQVTHTAFKQTGLPPPALLWWLLQNPPVSASPPGISCNPTAGVTFFGAVRNSVSPPARSTPPAMNPTVETAPSVVALLRSLIACEEHPVWLGHSFWAVP